MKSFFGIFTVSSHPSYIRIFFNSGEPNIPYFTILNPPFGLIMTFPPR